MAVSNLNSVIVAQVHEIEPSASRDPGDRPRCAVTDFTEKDDSELQWGNDGVLFFSINSND